MLFNSTDAGNAELFARFNKAKLTFCHQSGRWFIWAGSHWKVDESGKAYGYALQAVRSIRKTAYEEEPDTDKQRKLVGWSFKSESSERLGAMLKLASKIPEMTAGDWDADPWLLGTPTGTVDLRTGELRKARPSDRITKQVAVGFVEGQECPMWERALKAYWPEDDGMIDFIQRAIGYSLTGSIQEQLFFCLYGQGGNGKSTFLGVLEKLLGDYAYTMPFSTFELTSKSAISNDVASLQGRRFVISSETQEDCRLNEGRIKSLTGDPKITARFLHREYFTFRPVGKFWLAFNHRPRIVDASDGLWRRLRLIEFSQQFKDGERIKGLEETLEAEMAGILNWAVKGCLEWQKRGLEATKAIKDATAEYRIESNGMVEFLEQICDVSPRFAIPKQALFDAYIAWTIQVKERFPYSKHGFGSRMAAQGFRERINKVDGRTTRVWLGIGLNPQFDQYADTETVKAEVIQ